MELYPFTLSFSDWPFFQDHLEMKQLEQSCISLPVLNFSSSNYLCLLSTRKRNNNTNVAILTSWLVFRGKQRKCFMLRHWLLSHCCKGILRKNKVITSSEFHAFILVLIALAGFEDHSSIRFFNLCVCVCVCVCGQKVLIEVQTECYFNMHVQVLCVCVRV